MQSVFIFFDFHHERYECAILSVSLKVKLRMSDVLNS